MSENGQMKVAKKNLNAPFGYLHSLSINVFVISVC